MHVQDCMYHAYVQSFDRLEVSREKRSGSKNVKHIMLLYILYYIILLLIKTTRIGLLHPRSMGNIREKDKALDKGSKL